MTAREKTRDVALRIERRTGKLVDFNDVEALRRAELTLHRWAELECGDGNDRASWAIERDDDTGKPYHCIYWHDGRTSRRLIPDREAGALRRVAAICERNGLHFYHQTDPRGCALFVAGEPLTSRDYSSKGVGCSA